MRFTEAGAALFACFAIPGASAYLRTMGSTFQPGLPTIGKAVPSSPFWLHKIKYDGYRLILQRDGSRVRPFTRNGQDWSSRYPWIVESAL